VTGQTAVSEWTARPGFMRVIEALERSGCRVEGTGRQRRAQCPHHDDGVPSLGVADGMDKVLVKCRAGCDTADVLADLGMSWHDLFEGDSPDRLREDTWTPWRERCPCSPVAWYLYRDERGQLLYEHVRGEHKEFAFRRPDGSSKTGVRWNLDSTRRVLYRLPGILAAPRSGVVFVTEGESDADALVGAGEVATTTDSGALTGTGAKAWRPEWTEAIGGRDVLICADRDDPGRGHAQHVAERLDGHVRFWWIVQAAIGKDVRDHLAAGYSVTDLVWWS
jgi:hypothetical protein